MTATRQLVMLARPIQVRLDGDATRPCTALGPGICELELPEPLDADESMGLEITLPDEQPLRFTATAGEASSDGGVWRQRLELHPLDEADGRRYGALIVRFRKDAHLDLCAMEDVEANVSPGWDHVQLPHEALPELDGDEVDLSAQLLGKSLVLPLVITGMTGGSERGGQVNRALARVAQSTGIAMGLGSQRPMLEDLRLVETYRVRTEAPDIVLLANIGLVQLNYGITPQRCGELVEAVEADALCLHLNALQEMVQPEGDRNFSGLLHRIEQVVAATPVPVLLKETGAGIPAHLAVRAMEAGCIGVDISGVGGTSWARVEALRQSDPLYRDVGNTFRDWGIPTARALLDARQAAPDALIIGSGGVRTGLQMAKALALGADVCGMALPFLRAVLQSEEAATDLVRKLAEELRIAMFCAGTEDVAALRALGSMPLPGAGDE